MHHSLQTNSVLWLNPLVPGLNAWCDLKETTADHTVKSYVSAATICCWQWLTYRVFSITVHVTYLWCSAPQSQKTASAVKIKVTLSL